jgi:hypothetical protein
MEAGAPAGSACKPSGLRNRVVQPGGGALIIVASIQRAGQRLRRRGALIALLGFRVGSSVGPLS